MRIAIDSEDDAAVAVRPRLRVVHVVLSLECGGLEHVVVDLARIGRDAGQEVSVICLERKGILADTLVGLGIRVECLHKPSGLQFSLMRRRLRPLLRELRVDILHVHQIGALLYAGAAARAVGVPAIVHTEHGKHFGSGVKARWLGRLAARHADCFFCVSGDIAEEVVRLRIAGVPKVSVMPNGIDTTKFGKACDTAAVRKEWNIPLDAPVIGTVGRLAEIKRQDLLVRAFAHLLRKLPTAHLLLVGDGPMRSELERLADNLGVCQAVHFAGYREDRDRLLHAMDIFTLTSRSEGMPLSVLEAWAAGVPVVAAHVGGLPELIDHDRTGILVQGDDPETWSQVFVGLLQERQRANALRQQAKEECEAKYSLDAMLRSHESRYRAALRDCRAT